jgi:hypothetical protein
VRLLAWILWVVAAVWLVMAVFGAENFQELYGGTSGVQFFLLAFLTALVPAGLGWWAYRRSR